MIRILLSSMLLVVVLAGCNFPGVNTGRVTSAPPDDTSIIGKTAEATAESTSDSVEVVPIPVSSIEIEGVPYQAYQIPGDPFRFVCQEPCQLDPQYIYAEYAAFLLAHAMLVELTGIDTLTELQPVDMHLELKDSICGVMPVGHASIYAHKHQAYTCTEGPGYYPTVAEKIQKASQVGEQYFPVHEYMHTLFFGRISGNAGAFQSYKAEYFHDFVVPLPSYAVGILDPAVFCTYSNPIPPGDFEGSLISELCRQNGFQLTTLTLSLVELDRLYQSGGGQVDQEGFGHPAPGVAQYRDILNHLLGSDTTNAFIAAHWPPELFSNNINGATDSQIPVSIGTPTPIK